MNKYFQRTTSAAPLAIFRIAFGLLLFAGTIRFWIKGWIHELYIEPKYFFSFYGFEFVKPLGAYTYLLFAICAIAALFVALGFVYRVASVALFLSFTYIELIDKSLYLNHYYFISMISLLMIFLPAHAFFSVDAYRNKDLNSDRIPLWTVDSLKLFVCFLYFFAGLAKVNSDWLLNAQPLKIWLPAKNDLPLIGHLFNYAWVAYAFSWIGCVYDLSIPFLLWNRATRLFAFGAVVAFHLLTAILFPIGMFPYIMIATALIFFSSHFHFKIIVALKRFLKLPENFIRPVREYTYKPVLKRSLLIGFSLFFAIQIMLPFRHVFYRDELFWTEEGYRFSWRVMLMEKAGHAEFTVKDQDGRSLVVDNREFLTPLQEKMMATQPDMILQYAHLLSGYYRERGFVDPEVYVDSYVTLNGRLGKPLVNAATNLAEQKESFSHKHWILPFNNEIKGL
jgi:hypothetical protein